MTKDRAFGHYLIEGGRTVRKYWFPSGSMRKSRLQVSGLVVSSSPRVLQVLVRVQAPRGARGGGGLGGATVGAAAAGISRAPTDVRGGGKEPEQA